MKKFFSLLVLIAFCSCKSVDFDNTITQFSTIDALLAGAYDGQLTCKELLEYGDFGIGTFDKLDGEMVLFDGVVYQVKSDGKVYSPSGSMTTPFASVCFFDAKQTFKISERLDFASFKTFIDKIAPNKNNFCAIKFHGEFNKIKTRSVPAQKRPYPELKDIVKSQSVFEMDNISGTLVGIRSPVFVKGINVPGYHIHFISDSLTAGGHVLGFEIAEGLVEIDYCNKFFLILPENSKKFNEIDLSHDRSKELEAVEN